MGGDEFSDWHGFTLNGLHGGSNSIVFKVIDRGVITGLAVQWGTVLKAADEPLPRFTYTGQQYDPITRLYVYGNGTRVYEPVSGSFFQEDPAYLKFRI